MKPTQPIVTAAWFAFLAIWLALPARAQTAPQAASAQKAGVVASGKKTTASAAVTAPRRKKSPARLVKAVEANTPVQSLAERLSEQELETAQKIHIGKIRCELGNDLQISADGKNPGYFNVAVGKRRFYMHPVASRTGAIRMEDGRSGAMYLQLGDKSMLMDQKLGQRLADQCQSPAQQVFAEQLKTNPPPNLLEDLPHK
ncbi:MAG: hypothetical protein LBP52_02590 [Burkholderiaceae bacterium]|jgi:hypothetical protein|nr:hypothetical protein [Burkholderiaceae bacterium]